jgi:hypothetical protein
MRTDFRRLRRSWTVTDLVLLAAALVTIFIGLLAAQTPPLPPGTPLRPVRVAWDAQPASEYWNAFDTNGNFVGITYRVWQATNVTGPWSVAAVTTNTTATISNLTAHTQFFYVTASNFFLESEPSRLLSIPLDPVPATRLILE